MRSLYNIARKKWWSSSIFPRRCISQSAAHDCDIVIVGGGPVGLALASALGLYVSVIVSLHESQQTSAGSSRIIRDSLRIVLVEAGDLSQVRDWTLPPSSFSNRVSSLTNASQDFLKGTFQLHHGYRCFLIPAGIDAWNYIDLARTSPIEEMQVCYTLFHITLHVISTLGLGWFFRRPYHIFCFRVGSGVMFYGSSNGKPQSST